MSFHRVWSWAGCYLLRLRTVSQNRPGLSLAYVLPLSTYLPYTASQLHSALPERTFCFPTSTSLIFDTFPWAVSSAQQIPLYPSNPLSDDSSLMKWPHVPFCNDCSLLPEPPFSFRRTVHWDPALEVTVSGLGPGSLISRKLLEAAPATPGSGHHTLGLQ